MLYVQSRSLFIGTWVIFNFSVSFHSVLAASYKSRDNCDRHAELG